MEGKSRADARTFPLLLMEQAQIRPNSPAFRQKDFGIWNSTTWGETARQVRALACGLAALGFRRGMNLAIIGDNRPPLYWAIAATQCLGGIPVPLYQDMPAADLAYVLNDADIEFVFVEDQEQVDKILEVGQQRPEISRIVYEDERGMRNYRQPNLHSFQAVVQLGREFDIENPSYFDAEVERVRPEDIAIILYTSGTTGKSKGVCMAHAAMIDRAAACAQMEGLTDRDRVLSYLPMAWVGDNLFSYAQAMVVGFSVNCPESGDTVMTDMREIGPTYYFAPPRIFENMLTMVMIRMEDAGRMKRWLFHFFMKVAKKVGPRLLENKPVPLGDRIRYAIGNLLVYAPLRNVLGLSRIKVGYTAGEAIGPDLFSFFRSIGINLKQLYGTTETCVFVCIQPNDRAKFDSVGPPAPGVQVKISDSGEVLIKTPGMFKEYYKQPEPTSGAFDAQGWYLTGDAGFFDEDGHLKIIDRVKDVGRLANGAMFAPKYIENKLKFFPFIKEAVAFGDGRGACNALINIDMEAVGNWAERRGIPYSGYTDLAAQDAVYDLVAECVEKVNADLAGDAKLADSQIHRFLVLHKELDPDDDELTRTRKVRRRFIADKYKVLIDALYAGRHSQYIETQVKFEDGRQGMVAADLKIRDVKTYAAVRSAA